MEKKKIINFFLKIIFLLVLCLLTVIIVDYTTFQIDKFHFNLNYPKKYDFKYSLKFVPYSLTKIANGINRPIFNESSTKRPILLFGCSYAYGENLKNEQTFPYKLANKLVRPVITKAGPGYGPQHMLIQAMYATPKGLASNPEYAIYVMIPDHIRRMENDFFWPFFNKVYPKFDKNKSNSLELSSGPKWYQRLYIVKRCCEDKTYSDLYNPNKSKIQIEKYKLHIFNTKEYLTKRFPDIKFIVIFYPSNDNYFNDMTYNNSQLIQDLKNNGILLYKVPIKFSEKRYQIFDGHPNEKAWDSIVIDFVNKLNIH